MTAPTFAARAPIYRGLWDGVKINARQRSTVLATARKIAANKGRYEPVAAATGVPWYVVGIIHAMECGLRFDQHLHNGDPLTARTVQVPKGRPKDSKPPFIWEFSAMDALYYDKLDRVAAWPIERICYELEKYNGWGYALHHPGVNSPYLWSFTNHYTVGKYVADGEWSSTAVSGQSGAMALLKALIENGDVTLDDREGSSPSRVPVVETTTTVSVKERVGAELDFVSEKIPAQTAGREIAVPSTGSPPSPPRTSGILHWLGIAAKSKTILAIINTKILIVLGFLTDIGEWIVDWFGVLFGVLPAAIEETIELAGKSSRLSELIGFDWKRVALAVGIGTLSVALVRHAQKKSEAEEQKRELETLRGQQS